MVHRRLQRTNFADGEFLLINLMEPHTPHLPPEPFRTYSESISYNIGDAFANAIEEPYRNRRAYDDSAAYLSSVYREVYRELQQSFDMIITLSDHGELLGEHGLTAHGSPTCPELVYVPTVFVHPSLPSGASGAHLLKQTDIFPTIQSAVSAGEYAADGENLLETVEENRPAFSQGLMHPPPRFRETFLDPGYYAYGVWTRSGGHVFAKNSRIARLVTALYESTFSANTGAYNSHKHLIHRLNFTISHYLKNYHQYGTPEIGRDTALSFVDSLNTEIKEERNSRELSDGTLERLSNLGYK